jgi:SAM-dependent methyltransferase
MNEASKTRRVWTELELGILRGKGIDIGSGADPVLPGVRQFDREHGDANAISRHVAEQFDFVFSAHCLEHMHDPREAILEWWKLVRPGGHLFFIVPDEDLYEQGMWPSLFNPDHKATFTSTKRTSWSQVSVNVMDLVASLPGGDLVDARVHDAGYDRACLQDAPSSRLRARVVRSARWQALKMLRSVGIDARLNWCATVFRVPIDQTVSGALAQIQVIVRKRAGVTS